MGVPGITNVPFSGWQRRRRHFVRLGDLGNENNIANARAFVAPNPE
jgi:hypothetical protein